MWLSKNDWTFPILVDGGPVIREYGIPNPDHDGTEREGIPHPATIIVDTDGGRPLRQRLGELSRPHAAQRDSRRDLPFRGILTPAITKRSFGP